MHTFTVNSLKKALKIEEAMVLLKNATGPGKFLYNWKASGVWMDDDNNVVFLHSDKRNPTSYMMKEGCIYVLQHETYALDYKLRPTASSRISFNIFNDSSESISYLRSLK